MRYIDRIPVIKNGCCCCDLRICCIVIGVFQVVVLLFDFIAQIEWLVRFGVITTINEFGLLECLILFVDILVNVALITTTVFFIVGAHQKNTVQVKIYVEVTAWVILVYFFLGISLINYIFVIGSSYLVLVGWLFFVWLHAHSLHQQWLKQPEIRNLSTVMGRLERGDTDEIVQFCLTDDAAPDYTDILRTP